MVYDVGIITTFASPLKLILSVKLLFCVKNWKCKFMKFNNNNNNNNNINNNNNNNNNDNNKVIY